jgi:hypothetical protein
MHVSSPQKPKPLRRYIRVALYLLVIVTMLP